jgi:ribosomal protein S12 methylthiotransferase accessory factor YcaO
MDVEQLAKKLFEYYGLRETGSRPAWEYLKKERQLEWMQDVHLIADALLSDLKKKVRPVSLPPGTINTSFTMGLSEGIKQERVNFITLIEQLERDVENQIHTFKDKT